VSDVSETRGILASSAVMASGTVFSRASGYLRIIESSKAKTSQTPVYGFDGAPAPSGSGE